MYLYACRVFFMRDTEKNIRKNKIYLRKVVL